MNAALRDTGTDTAVSKVVMRFIIVYVTAAPRNVNFSFIRARSARIATTIGEIMTSAMWIKRRH